MKKKDFLLNAAIMAVSSLLLRFTNIGFRVYLSQKIGAAGMGLYQLILSVFLLAITISTSGIQLAVTRLVAEAMGLGNPGKAKKAMRRCMAWGLGLSLCATSVLFLGADWIALHLFADPRTAAPLRILSPGLPFMAVSSCLRGYFIAVRNTAKPASAEILEQFSTIGIVVALFLFFSPQGLEAACCAIMLGSTSGEVLSCAWHFLLYTLDTRKRWRGQKCEGRGVFRQIIHIALPAMTGYTARNILSAAENILIPRGLKKNGAQTETALAEYGMVQGMVLPLLSFPSAFLSAFSSLLIPEVAEANAAGKKRHIEYTTVRSMQMTLLFSFFAAAVFWAYSPEFGVAFYQNERAGALLRLMAPLIPLMYLDSVVDAILKGLDQQVSSLKYNFSDSCFRVILVYFLVPIAGVKGYLCVLFFSTIYNASLSIHRLLKVSEIHLSVQDWIIKPALSGALAVNLVLLAGKFCHVEVLSPGLSAAIQILPAAVLYCAFLRICGSFNREDSRWLRSLLRESLGKKERPILSTRQNIS